MEQEETTPMTKIDGGLRSLFRERIPTFMWTSIETGGTGRGVPDSNYISPKGIEGWIEFKRCDHWKPVFRPEQIGWITRRIRYNGRICIGVRQQDHDDTLWLVRGRVIKELAVDGLRNGAVQRHSTHMAGGPNHWDWDLVQLFLTTT